MLKLLIWINHHILEYIENKFYLYKYGRKKSLKFLEQKPLISFLYYLYANLIRLTDQPKKILIFIAGKAQQYFSF